MSRKDRGTLLAILDSIEKILSYVRGISSAEGYFQSPMAFDATLMNFINIGEMADRVSVELKSKHPEVGWQKMKDFRNLVAHDYLGINAEEVWQIIKVDLPKLESSLKKILGSTALD